MIKIKNINVMKTAFFFLFCIVLATDVFAVNRDLLDPRDSVSKQQVDKLEAQVEGSAATLLKRGEFEGKLDTEVNTIVTELYKTNPQTDKVIMNKILLYLFCTMLEDNKSISDKGKFDRLQYLADSIK